MLTKCRVCNKTTTAYGFGAYCKGCVGKKPAKRSLVDAQLERDRPKAIAEIQERHEMSDAEMRRLDEYFATMRRHREEAGDR